MGNMSYCRFQNTSKDLSDCVDAIKGAMLSDMSRDEKSAFIDLIMSAKEIAEQFEDYNEDELRKFIEDAQDKDDDPNEDEDE